MAKISYQWECIRCRSIETTDNDEEPKCRCGSFGMILLNREQVRRHKESERRVDNKSQKD